MSVWRRSIGIEMTRTRRMKPPGIVEGDSDDLDEFGGDHWWRPHLRPSRVSWPLRNCESRGD
jgi:hypothetical protein